jgi:hypothetical protein
VGRFGIGSFSEWIQQGKIDYDVTLMRYGFPRYGFPVAAEGHRCYIYNMPPKPCNAYYYGGLRVKGSRRKGRLWVEAGKLHFDVPEGKGAERIRLEIPPSKMEKVFLTRDNYYGTDTVLFNITFRDQTEQSFTLRFAPVALIPRRRIALQKEWFDYLAKATKSFGGASPLSTK